MLGCLLLVVLAIAGIMLILSSVNRDGGIKVCVGLSCLIVSIVILCVVSINMSVGYPSPISNLDGAYEVLFYSNNLPDVIVLRGPNGRTRLCEFDIIKADGDYSKFVKVVDQIDSGKMFIFWNPETINVLKPFPSENQTKKQKEIDQ